LYEKINKKFYHSDAYASTIVDKVGAGDAMLSILAICLYNKIEINLSLLISSFSAAQKIKSIGNKYSIDKVDLLKELEHFLS
jgi:sugar/nucleoside kinase (ribokinase family)